MEKFTRTLETEQQSWSDGGRSTADIPDDHYVSEILARCEVTYDSAAGATVDEDGVLNAIKRMSLKVGSKVIRSWSPSRYWYKLPLDLGTKPEFVDVTDAEANGKTASFVLPIPFRLDPQDDNDVTALLPAGYLSNIELEIEWGAAGDLGTNQTITSATVDLQLKEVSLTSTEEQNFYGATGSNVARQGSGLIQIVETEQTVTVDAAYSELDSGLSVSLPTGAVLTRQHLFAYDQNGARDDTLVDRYKVQQVSPRRAAFLHESWAFSQAKDRQEYRFPTPIEGDYYLPGLTVLDYVDFGTLDLRNKSKGQVQAFFATSSGGSGEKLVFLHEQLNEPDYLG